MSGGQWSYNRFDTYENKLTEGSKPDFLDFDKDGNKEEPMKKALKQKGKSKKDDCECKEEVELEEGSCGGKGYQMGGKVGYQKGGEVKPKKTVVKEDVLEYIMEKGMANNIVFCRSPVRPYL